MARVNSVLIKPRAATEGRPYSTTDQTWSTSDSWLIIPGALSRSSSLPSRRKRSHDMRYATLALLLISLLSVGVSAQTFRGTILGTVTDPNGALVAGAKVTVK